MRRVVLAILGALVGLSVVLAALYLVPFPGQVAYRTQFHSSAAAAPGCGRSTEGLDVSSGQTIHLSWLTTPAVSVTLTVSPLSGGPVVYNGTGVSGSGSFSSTVVTYLLAATNCGDVGTTVTVSAHYDFEAPLF
ncbi:MAG TPA: hypothetical protein VEH28_02065 [Thermoplasmata archaeon]|nr:hypothetical protein [Thermoplasmata archaeon]